MNPHGERIFLLMTGATVMAILPLICPVEGSGKPAGTELVPAADRETPAKSTSARKPREVVRTLESTHPSTAPGIVNTDAAILRRATHTRRRSSPGPIAQVELAEVPLALKAALHTGIINCNRGMGTRNSQQECRKHNSGHFS